MSHFNRWKPEYLTAKQICHHIHSGLMPGDLTRVHPEDEDTPIISIPFQVVWKATWLTKETVMSSPMRRRQFTPTLNVSPL